MTDGPRPMSPAEWEAYTLHLQRVPVEVIEQQTELTRPRIAAAVDLGRLHAQAKLQPLAAAAKKPAAVPGPPRIRQAARRQLPGAITPPAASLPMPAELSSATDAPPRPNTPAAAVIVKPAPARPAATAPTAAAPDLDRLARSSKVRTWAIGDGWTVPPAGQRLPGAIVHAYLRAHGGTQ